MNTLDQSWTENFKTKYSSEPKTLVIKGIDHNDVEVSEVVQLIQPTPFQAYIDGASDYMAAVENMVENGINSLGMTKEEVNILKTFKLKLQTIKPLEK